MTTREQEAAWREVLRTSASEPVGLALEGLCKVDMNRIKEAFIDASPEQIPMLQGEARAIRKVLKYLTERPLPQPSRFDTDVASNL